MFSCKDISQIASITFATQCFFTDHFNCKTVNKTTCRAPSANTCQLWAYQLKSFRAVAIIFGGFQDFLIYLAKNFWSLINSPNLITQQCFARAMYIKQFIFFLVSLKYREIATVKTVTFYKKLYFFFIKSLKSNKKKQAPTLFYYVIWEIWSGNSKKLIWIDQSRF